MKVHEGEFTVGLMCRVLSVSRSGYYAWRGRTPSKRAQARARLDAKVRVEFEARKGRAGAPRLSRRLGVGRPRLTFSLDTLLREYNRLLRNPRYFAMIR